MHSSLPHHHPHHTASPHTTTHSLAMENREERLTEVYEEIEKGMVLIGATAIEDKSPLLPLL